MNDKNLSVKIPLEVRGIFAGHFKFGGQYRTFKTQILRTKTQHLFGRLNSFFHLVAIFAVTNNIYTVYHDIYQYKRIFEC